MIPKAKAWTVRVYWTEGNRKDTTVYEAYGPTKLFAWWNARPKVMKAYLIRNNPFDQTVGVKPRWHKVTISVKREVQT